MQRIAPEHDCLTLVIAAYNEVDALPTLQPRIAAALDAAEAFAERLREAIEAYLFVSDIRLTISLGVGEYVPGENEFELFQRIDRARTSSESRYTLESLSSVGPSM